MGLCALVLGTAVLGACSDDATKTADPDRSTTTTRAPAATDAPTSTTFPPSELAVVVHGGALGWWQDGSWHQADRERPIPIEAGAEFTVLRLTGPAETSTGGTPDVPEEFCSSAYVPLDPMPEDDGGHDWVGVHGVANPSPARPRC